jgi:hypothetical protein
VIVSPNPLVPISELQWRTLRKLYPDDYMREVAKAMAIAKDLETCKSLLRGEGVTADRIDWEAAKNYEVRL